MPDDAPLSRSYIIQGGKVVIADQVGVIQTTGDVTVAFLDTQPVSFDYLAVKSATQVLRLLDELQSSGRYNAEAYEPRPEIEQHINHFLASPKVGLLIFGESGVGKSNVLTHLCQQLCNDGQVVLFYEGSDFFDDLNVEQRILKDCDCVHKTPSLASLLETLNTLNQTRRLTSFVVLVDSVESAREPARLLRVLDSIIASVPYPWFKVVATVQTGAYEAIVSEHDKASWRPTSPMKYYLPDGSKATVTFPGIALGHFNPIELHGAWNKARTGINFKSLPETTRTLIRHPYFFRLFIELYRSGADTASLLAVSTLWELSRHYYETRLPPLKGRQRNLSRVLLNELISKLLEKRFIWFSILELAEDPAIGRYFADYEANRPYADLLTSGILWEHATPDKADVRVSFTPNQFFAYALYEYFRECSDLTIDYLVAIVADLLPGPMGISLEDIANLDEGIATVDYFRTLRNFWYPPLVEAIAHLLADHWNAGEEETFVVKFLVHCYGAPGGWYAAEGISVKLVEVIARTNPDKLGQLIPTMIAVYPGPQFLAEDRILGQLFNELAENALTQEATSIVNVLLAECSNSPAEVVELYLVLARVHRAAHNDERRLAHLLEANRHATASGDVVKMGRVANAIGVFYNETGGDPASAIQWLERGLELAAKAGQSQESIAASHFNISVALANQREFSRAVSHLEQSLKLTDGKKTPVRVAQILTKIGNAQKAQRNFEQALDAYQQAAPLYEANNQGEQVVDLAFHIGDILMMTRQFPQAVAHFRQCLEEDNPNLSPDQQFALMANLALALAGVEGNTTEATTWFQKANEYHGDIGLPLTEDYFITQLNFARFLSHVNKYSEAATVYATALRELGPDIDEVFRHTLGVELGSVYVKTGDYQLAVQYITNGLPFFEATRQERALADLYAILGNAYREQGLTAQATEYYHKSYPLLLKFGMNETAAKVEAYLAEA